VLAEERRAGRMTRRRVFTNLPGWRRNVLNVDPTTAAAHDSYVWNGQLHAADLGATRRSRCPSSRPSARRHG
jgi:hypothetical protein